MCSTPTDSVIMVSVSVGEPAAQGRNQFKTLVNTWRRKGSTNGAKPFSTSSKQPKTI